MTDLDTTATASATALVGELTARRLSSRELLETYLDRIERLDPAINAVVTLDTERARAAADAADRAAAAGEPLGPLHGLPVTVKDTLETAGLRTTSGAPDLAGHVPDRDADAVALLRAAGAVVFGKTNTATFAADAQTYNPVFGTTNNPWDPARSPGGSSGGPAAAVAAGLTGLDLASELSGSARLPAHHCGVFTLRPSHGLVPTRGNIPRAPGSLRSNDMVTLAPVTRSADDLALALSVLAGPVGPAARAWRLELPPPRAGRLADYRIALWLDDPHLPLDGQVRTVLAAALDRLTAAGAVVEETVPLDLAAHDRLYQQLLQGAVSLGRPRELYDRDAAAAAGLDPQDDSPRARMLRAATQSHRDWLVADEAREQLRARWERFFTRYDVLLCPVATTTAIAHDHDPDFAARRITVNGAPRPYWDQIGWTSLATAGALPAASVPVGLSGAGLPVGLQVVGPHLEDRTVLDLARRIAEATGGYRAPGSARG